MKVKIAWEARSTVGGAGAAGIFYALPFLGFGLGILFYALGCFVTLRETGRWIEVDAFLQELRFCDSIIGPGGVPTPMPSFWFSYPITGTYLYQWQGKELLGKRFAIKDNFGGSRSEWENLFRPLEQAKASDKPIRILVNPDNPRESLVFRRLSLFMTVIFLTGFILLLVGGAMAVEGLGGFLRYRKAGELRRRLPDEPWKAVPIWLTRQIRVATTSNLVQRWGMAGMTGILAMVTLVNLGFDNSQSILVRFVPLPFLAVFFSFLWNAVQRTRLALTKGELRFLLSQLPIVPGKTASGVLSAPEGLLPREINGLIRAVPREEAEGEGAPAFETVFQTSKTRGKDGLGIFLIPIHVPAEIRGKGTQKPGNLDWILRMNGELENELVSIQIDLPVFEVKDPSLIEADQKTSL